ncbi:MAG TPA: PQQ-dependent sugar dehydrogenase, partial [Methylomirabilota bacterium]|nr:PQQ-dependent sugar dehydrogenase [Methylomirabilota bacterium]
MACLVAGMDVGRSDVLREAAPTVRMPAVVPVSGYGLVDALPGLTFSNPVVIASPPGETNRLFVAERGGKLIVITNLAAPTKTVFLDLSSSVQAAYVEAGLLGLAFHPGYATNRQFFVYRTQFTTSPGGTNVFHNVLSRFETSPLDPNVGMPASEVPLIRQVDVAEVHNAGDIQFGPDGYLYLSTGTDGPPPAEATTPPHSIDGSFFGSILRIDVDKRPGSLPPNPHPAATDNYAIPPDNPFVNVTNYQGRPVDPTRVRTEIYALGFRNPYRLSFDPLTGLLYCGDVGEDQYEEVNVVTAGGHYGWPYVEGPTRKPSYDEAPPAFAELPPLVFYGHGSGTNQGTAIIGGLVYRAGGIPELQGAYLFADYWRGHLWMLRHEGTNVTTPMTLLTSETGISCFGRDPRDGEVLVANHGRGVLKRLVHVPPAESAWFPPTLADTGVFADTTTLRPNPGVYPYELNVPFWSDHAIKSRWFTLPDPSQRIGFRASENWLFPTGMVWIKHFEMELMPGVPASRRRLETRLLVRNLDGVYGVTYRWDETQTNAVLVDARGMDEVLVIRDPDGGERNQVWHYPSRNECITCHTPAGGYALGFGTAQLHREIEGPSGTESQLSALARAGFFAEALPPLDTLRRLVGPQDLAEPLQDRVRSYLAANCSQCHTPGGFGFAHLTWDARLTPTLRDTRLLEADRIVPGRVQDSVLLRRISTQSAIRMPPIGSTIPDTNGIALIARWIDSLPQAPWSNQDLGAPPREGSAAVEAAAITVAGAGTGLAAAPGDADQCHFLYRPLPERAQWIVRLAGRHRFTPGAAAGILFRASLALDAPLAALWVGGDGQLAFQSRTTAGQPVVTTTGGAAPDVAWLRLDREDGRITGYASASGSNWTLISTAEWQGT